MSGATARAGAFTSPANIVELEPFSRIVHVERMHLPDPTPDNHVETQFEPDGSGTLMTMRMTLPDADDARRRCWRPAWSTAWRRATPGWTA